jgi:hypothetical protein
VSALQSAFAAAASLPSVPVQQPGDLASCAVCERTILPGERISQYVAPDGERVGVCALCKPRAEASGWIPAEHASRLAREPAPRPRRSLNLRQRLSKASERLSKASEAASARLTRRPEAEAEATGADAGQEERRSPRPAPARRRRQPQQADPAKRGPGEPLTRERLLRLAVDAFNAGPGPRKIAGLVRSLGEPHVAVRPDGAAKALVTVAWELSWYQWDVDLRDEAEVREVRKGSELSELESDEQAWNASVADDGQLRLERAAARSAGGSDT